MIFFFCLLICCLVRWLSLAPLLQNTRQRLPLTGKALRKKDTPVPRFGTRACLLRGATQIRKWLNASLLRKDTGCAGPAISAQCALYACSADVLPDAAAKAFQQNGLLSGQAGNRYCFHVVAKDRIIELNAYFSSSYANPDRRAAIRGSAFLPRPDLLRTGRWTSRTGGACA